MEKLKQQQQQQHSKRVNEIKAGDGNQALWGGEKKNLG